MASASKFAMPDGANESESMSHTQPPQVWPVIHLDTPDVAYCNAELARRCGCPGVFLIEMDGCNDAIDPVAIEVKRRFPGLKVGVNYLGMPAHLAVAHSLALGLDATWTDNPGVRSDGVHPMVREATVPVLQQNPGHLFFGSVAFKYQPEDADPPAAARAALALGMIPTTSGPATGMPPQASKLHAMREAVGTGPLAVASGIDPDNAYELGRFLTHILVSTGISSSFYEFDEGLLRRLMGQLEG